MRTPEEALGDIFDGFSSQTFVEKPCVITNVIDQYTVDVTYYDNNEANLLVRVPVKHLQTNSAYVFLGLKEGDCGTVRFFDNDVNSYYDGDAVASTEERTHDINDNCYTYGFYPAASQYIFPDGDIVIGTTAGATINITEKEIKINAETIIVENEATIDITSDSDITIKTDGELSVTTQSDLTINSSANVSVTTQSDLTINSLANVSVTAAQNVDITGVSNVSVSGATVSVGSATTIDGVNFLAHTHYDVANANVFTGRVYTQ